jgi:hypothetical protein
MSKYNFYSLNMSSRKCISLINASISSIQVKASFNKNRAVLAFSKTIKLAFLSLLICMSSPSFARDYVTPPSTSTSSNVPWISDVEMERCVKSYNEAKWLSEEMNSMVVDQYSQNSVDTYNTKVTHHSQMIDLFNQKCAGKQSESAYKAAQKLNRQL